jgi:hypothetical protein
VANWVYEIAKRRSDAEFEVVDIKDFNLPLLDEPMPPIMGQYAHHHTKDWSAKIASFDAYVFVTPENNHAIRWRYPARNSLERLLVRSIDNRSIHANGSAPTYFLRSRSRSGVGHVAYRVSRTGHAHRNRAAGHSSPPWNLSVSCSPPR